MRRFLPLILLLVLPACPLFQRLDVAPVLEASKKQAQVFEELAAAWAKHIRQAQATDAQKAAVLAAIDKARDQYRRLQTAVLEWLEANGLDPKLLIGVVRSLLDDWRASK